MIIFNREETGTQRDEGTQMTSGHKFTRVESRNKPPRCGSGSRFLVLATHDLSGPLHEILRKVEWNNVCGVLLKGTV